MKITTTRCNKYTWKLIGRGVALSLPQIMIQNLLEMYRYQNFNRYRYRYLKIDLNRYRYLPIPIPQKNTDIYRYRYQYRYRSPISSINVNGLLQRPIFCLQQCYIFRTQLLIIIVFLMTVLKTV